MLGGQVDVYDGTPDFLRQLQLDQDALNKAIIGTIGDSPSFMATGSNVQSGYGKRDI